VGGVAGVWVWPLALSIADVGECFHSPSALLWCGAQLKGTGKALPLHISHIKPFGAYMGQIVIIYCNFIISSFLSLKILTDPLYTEYSEKYTMVLIYDILVIFYSTEAFDTRMKTHFMESSCACDPLVNTFSQYEIILHCGLAVNKAQNYPHYHVTCYL
jgi:hypothetical protein